MGRPDERGLRIFLTISGSAVEADVPFGGGIAPGAGVDQLQGLEQRGIKKANMALPGGILHHGVFRPVF